MGNINVIIDGKKVKVREGSTIFEAAEACGVTIPTFCHIKGLLPTGVCRVCVVEVKGSKTLVGACHTPASEGMIVSTHTRGWWRAQGHRGADADGHTGDCVNDPNAENCKLHNLASDYEVGAPRFNVKSPRFYPPRNPTPT